MLGQRGIVFLLGEVGIEVAHHRNARGRRRDDDFGVREHLHETTGQPERLLLVTRVEVQLTTACLRSGEVDCMAEPLK